MNSILAIMCMCPSCFEEIFFGECRIISGRTNGLVLKVPQKGQYARINTEWVGNTSGFIRFTCLNLEIERKYTREYFEHLFTGKQVLPVTIPRTQAPAEPLIYELVLNPSLKYSKTANLLMYDAASEYLVNEQRLVQFARFTLVADAFIFVVDPLATDAFFKHLPSEMQGTFALAQQRRAADLLNSVTNIYLRYNGVSNLQELPDTPVAVMLSKSDMFKYLVPAGNYHFMTHPLYGNGIDLQDINIVDQEVRELLRRYRQSDLISIANRFKQVKFFATSATGEPPNAKGYYISVKPCRCPDPVLWILHQLDIIEAIEADEFEDPDDIIKAGEFEEPTKPSYIADRFKDFFASQEEENFKEPVMSSTPSNLSSKPFDVFLCHNSKDKPEVKEIANQLKAQGIVPWLDEWELQPGLPWQPPVERQIGENKSVAVFVGANGFGPWQNMEMNAFLSEFVHRGCPVIPVVLKTAPDRPELPAFLAGMTRVNFHKQEPDPIKHLVWGITSKKPDVHADQNASVRNSFVLIPSASSTAKTLPFPKRAELVDILLEFSCVRNRDYRETIVSLWNEQIPGIANVVPRRDTDKAQVMEIVSTSLRHPRGLQEFVDIVIYFAVESVENVQQLKTFMQNNSL